MLDGTPVALPPLSVTSPTGKVWMDRNLGASRVATSSTDYQAYGGLYQWGRNSDGHQVINWTSATGSDGAEQSNEVAGSVSSGSEGTSFIRGPSDWLSVQDNTRWNGSNKGVHDPCPGGYRVPTEAEWDTERLAWSSNNAAGAYGSPLKLPVAGYRSSSNGALSFVGSSDYYWSATVSGTNARSLYFNSSNAFVTTGNRAYGFSVRCIKD